MRFFTILFFVIISLPCLSYENSPVLEEQFKALALEAEKNHLESQYRLFLLVSKNEPHLNHHATYAFKHMVNSGKSGHTESQFLIGSLYQTGIMVVKDYDAALTWLKVAASKGHIEAQYMTGSNYHLRLKGKLSKVERDEFTLQAINWYSQAMKSGSLDAMRNLGLILLTENKDFEKGNKLILDAAIAGDKRAMYFEGIRIKHIWRKTKNINDYNTAKDWFQKAYSMGHVESKKKYAELIDYCTKNTKLSYCA